MLQVEAKFGTDLQLIKCIDIRGTSESFKETQTEQNSDQLLWLCKALGTACLVLQLKYFSLQWNQNFYFSHIKKVAIWPLSKNLRFCISALWYHVGICSKLCRIKFPQLQKGNKLEWKFLTDLIRNNHEIGNNKLRVDTYPEEKRSLG